MFVHASPRDPTNEYVFPEYVFDQRKMELLFGKVDRFCFNGHTHLPGVFTTGCEFISPEDCDHRFPLGKEKLIINVGSVGQPRDENPKSCYAIVDDDEMMVRYRRVEYDVEKTARKIYAEDELPNMLGDRLKHGR